jgi:hypothetical protein
VRLGGRRGRVRAGSLGGCRVWKEEKIGRRCAERESRDRVRGPPVGANWSYRGASGVAASPRRVNGSCFIFLGVEI